MLYLVRHGRTEANASGLLLGRADPPLDDLGERQATAIGSMIGDVDLVVSSPLRRAVQTAEVFGREIVVESRWIELDYGTLDGTALSEVSSATWEAWRSDLDLAPPGGESHRQLGDRVHSACEELLEAALAGDVVVVSHVSPIKSAVAWALGVGDEIAWRCHLATGSVTTVTVGAAGPVLRGFNDISHLGGDR
ncbi:MAG: histidine phosphatase family protein [Actinomycetota bacterium]|nr:histidine phosphatase family protein [Actinomycetota bacterium]